MTGGRLVAFVATADPTRALAFYRDTLGLTLIEDTTSAIVFEGGGGTLRVAKVTSFVPQPFTVAGWEVANLNARMRDLASRGVDFVRFDGLEQDAEGVWTAPGGAQIAWFRDADGNLLSLTGP